MGYANHNTVKIYKENKERLKKKLLKDIKIFVKKKNKKRNNMVMKDTKIYIKMKKKLLSLEKITI